jgi:predicted transcriptional regulator
MNRYKEGDLKDGKVILNDDLMRCITYTIDTGGITRNNIRYYMLFGTENMENVISRLKKYGLIKDNQSGYSFPYAVKPNAFWDRFIGMSEAVS